MKAAIKPTAISIQFWPSKPRKVKCSVRNCTATAPIFVQDKRLSSGNILFLYSAGRTALICETLVGVSLTVFWGWCSVLRRRARSKQKVNSLLPGWHDGSYA